MLRSTYLVILVNLLCVRDEGEHRDVVIHVHDINLYRRAYCIVQAVGYTVEIFFHYYRYYIIILYNAN